MDPFLIHVIKNKLQEALDDYTGIHLQHEVLNSAFEWTVGRAPSGEVQGFQGFPPPHNAV